MMSATLPADLERLLAAQERYEQLERRTRRNAGPQVCDLGYANAYGGPPPLVFDAIRDCLADARALELQDTPYGGATITRRLVAERLRHSHGLDFRWPHVIMTPGAMAGLNILFRALKTEDEVDEVIVVVPCWLDYPLYLANLGLRPVLVPLASATFQCPTPSSSPRGRRNTACWSSPRSCSITRATFASA